MVGFIVFLFIFIILPKTAKIVVVCIILVYILAVLWGKYRDSRDSRYSRKINIFLITSIINAALVIIFGVKVWFNVGIMCDEYSIYIVLSLVEYLVLIIYWNYLLSKDALRLNKNKNIALFFIILSALLVIAMFWFILQIMDLRTRLASIIIIRLLLVSFIFLYWNYFKNKIEKIEKMNPLFQIMYINSVFLVLIMSIDIDILSKKIALFLSYFVSILLFLLITFTRVVAKSIFAKLSSYRNVRKPTEVAVVIYDESIIKPLYPVAVMVFITIIIFTGMFIFLLVSRT